MYLGKDMIHMQAEYVKLLLTSLVLTVKSQTENQWVGAMNTLVPLKTQWYSVRNWVLEYFVRVYSSVSLDETCLPAPLCPPKSWE